MKEKLQNLVKLFFERNVNGKSLLKYVNTFSGKNVTSQLEEAQPISKPNNR